MSDQLTEDPIVYGRRVALDIWDAATEIDEGDNKGVCFRSINLSKIQPKYREGIVFYSPGHGWRVHRKPKDWRQVFKERFPAIYAEMTEEES